MRLTDEQVSDFLNALTRPMFNWRMSGSTGNWLANTNALEEVRRLIERPVLQVQELKDAQQDVVVQTLIDPTGQARKDAIAALQKVRGRVDSLGTRPL